MDNTPQPDRMWRDLAVVISDALKAAEIPLREASLQTGIPTSTLHRRLNAVSPLLVTELNALAQILGTTSDDLVAKAQGRGAAA